ncbi:hypothetical protein SCAR479_05115 [Seiridium cardinale]|uniref:Uncharacterized protein n=1 Tax=Seiridium cardinale TaxID=138064 RepID=A0ABR2XWU0_9PEZI
MRLAANCVLFLVGSVVAVGAEIGTSSVRRNIQDTQRSSAIAKVKEHRKLSWEQSINREELTSRDVTSSPCTSASFAKPVYQILNFQFNETLSGTPARDLGLTSFQLLDTTNDNSFACTTPYLQDPNNGAWSECGPPDDATSPRTLFRHEFENRAVDIDQMWVCDQSNETFPHLFYSLATLNYAESLVCDNTDGSDTHTHCTIPDEASAPFSGDYTPPYWGTESPEAIAPAPLPANASDAPPSNGSPCIGLSFTYPNWDVGNFTYTSGDGGPVTFALKNHANGQSTICSLEAGQLGDGQWATCDNSTQVSFSQQTGILLVDQTWQCSITNYAEPVTFNAFGNTTLILDCQEGDAPCSAPDAVIKGSLTEPIELTPNAAPKGINYPNCLQNSESPSWEVSELIWRETFVNNRNLGAVDAIFTNNANGVTISCSASGEELNIIGSDNHERWWGCALIEREAFPTYQIISKIKLNPVALQFAINQPWWCNGNEEQPPAKFIGEGLVDVPFSCSWANISSTSSGPDTTCPISNSTGWNCTQTCTIDTALHMPGTMINKTTLPPDEFVEPAPSGYSCTIGSVLSPKWRIPWSSLTPYWGNPLLENTTETTISFDLQNMVLGGYVAVSQTDTTLTPLLPESDPDQWFDCVDNENQEVPTVLTCQWQFDLKTAYFAIKQSWYCDDKDPEHPIIFEGEGSRIFDYTCYVDRQSKDITCSASNVLDPGTVLPTTFEWYTAPDVGNITTIRSLI